MSAVRASTEKAVLDPRPRRATSIRAHIVEAVSVQMAYAEMDEIVRMLEGIDPYVLTETQQMVRDEFINAVNSIR